VTEDYSNKLTENLASLEHNPAPASIAKPEIHVPVHTNKYIKAQKDVTTVPGMKTSGSAAQALQQIMQQVPPSDNKLNIHIPQESNDIQVLRNDNSDNRTTVHLDLMNNCVKISPSEDGSQKSDQKVTQEYKKNKAQGNMNQQNMYPDANAQYTGSAGNRFIKGSGGDADSHKAGESPGRKWDAERRGQDSPREESSTFEKTEEKSNRFIKPGSQIPMPPLPIGNSGGGSSKHSKSNHPSDVSNQRATENNKTFESSTGDKNVLPESKDRGSVGNHNAERTPPDIHGNDNHTAGQLGIEIVDNKFLKGIDQNWKLKEGSEGRHGSESDNSRHDGSPPDITGNVPKTMKLPKTIENYDRSPSVLQSKYKKSHSRTSDHSKISDGVSEESYSHHRGGDNQEVSRHNETGKQKDRNKFLSAMKKFTASESADDPNHMNPDVAVDSKQLSNYLTENRHLGSTFLDFRTASLVNKKEKTFVRHHNVKEDKKDDGERSGGSPDMTLGYGDSSRYVKRNNSFRSRRQQEDDTDSDASPRDYGHSDDNLGVGSGDIFLFDREFFS
jgi:hypothetical protein